MVRVAEDRSTTSRVVDFWNGAALFSKRLFLVFHMDDSILVLLPQRGLDAIDGAAIPFLQRLDSLQAARRVSLGSSHGDADLCTIFCFSGVANASRQETTHAARQGNSSFLSI